MSDVKYSPQSTAVASTRTQRACDQCRQRKARCDGLGAQDKRCTPCAAAGRACTYTNFKRKSAPKQKASPEYVEELERTIEKMREMLMAATPGVDILSDIGRSEPSTPASSTNPFASRKDFVTACLNHLSGKLEPDSHSDGDDEDVYVSAGDVKDMAFGRSSAADLMRDLANMKNKTLTQVSPSPAHPVNDNEPEIFVSPHSMTKPITPDRFPDNETLKSLAKVYFDNVHIFWPFLHQPTVEKQIEMGLYLVDPNIGALVIMIACVASRYSDDYRRFWNIADHPMKSVVWDWFHLGHQLRKVSLLSLANISLLELQINCLSSIFLVGYHYGHAGWVICGVGLRLVQASGVHKRQKHSKMPLVEGEFFKRAIWTLTSCDIYWSAGLGRMPMHKTSDLGPAIECDDEYIFGSEQVGSNRPFQQPKDKPSKIAFFNRMSILYQLMGFVLHTIYSAKSFRAIFKTEEPDYDQHLVRELDSAMNRWLEETPPHLRWDLNNEDDTFFVQSAVLHCTFYFVQILIHKPFIPIGDKPSTSPLPSLAICLNAARACCRIGEEHLKRKGISLPDIQFPIYIAGLILLTSSFKKKQVDGAIVLNEKEVADVRRCLAVIESTGDRFNNTRRMRLMLEELISGTPEPNEDGSFSPEIPSSAEDSSFSPPIYNMNGMPQNAADSPEGWSSLFATFGQYTPTPPPDLTNPAGIPYLSDNFAFDPISTYMPQDSPLNSWFYPMAAPNQGFYTDASSPNMFQNQNAHPSNM